ncbi:NfeD family protein [Cellulomonas sp. Sa3CUA2]|uniref:NfeD family protein n=1 Tax=Cellulomonas avistercoris TaxID=2762242 RepID=A0ABR8QIP2_9CELL|nr:NfeD family protein [Cellulomonas avistercoris]MBD7920308.1 NfeD family protein [Cellulomonas avistercoris]
MTVFLVIGGIGLVLLLASLVFGDVFESFDIGEGGFSGIAAGIGAVVFGASGVLALAADLPLVWAYVIGVGFAVLASVVAQRVIKQLSDTEDGPPPPLDGAFGMTTATTGPSGGEVRLEGVRDLEARLAWAEEEIAAGTRVVVVAVSGSRVQVRPA